MRFTLLRAQLLVQFFVLLLLTIAMASITTSRRVAILGGGIHGCSTAYHLSKMHNILPIIIERSAVGAAASGKSGGFLARGWGNGITSQLHEFSYDLHEKLAAELDIKSYRKVKTLSVDGSKKGSNGASWLDRKATSKLMDENTAQVTPMELTTKLLEAAMAKGASYMKATVTGIEIEGQKVVGVRLEDGTIVSCSVVVVCLGPWSGVFCEDHFDMPFPMDGVKSTSIVYQNVEEINKEPFALFCDEDNNGCHMEVYPRSSGEVYLCGLGGSGTCKQSTNNLYFLPSDILSHTHANTFYTVTLSSHVDCIALEYVSGDRLRKGGDCERPELIKADPKRVEAASSSFRSMTSLGDPTPDITQACMRPCPSDALPVMGKIDGIEGAYVSAGHNVRKLLFFCFVNEMFSQ